ncbi:MAG: hypothetical protein Kow00109_17590 [Acidobacteriota bacterium]
MFILCKFWEEDGVWNGSCLNLPAAVFGATLEEAQRNLRQAVEQHFEEAGNLGILESVIKTSSDALRRLEKLLEREVSPEELIQKIPPPVLATEQRELK